MFLGAGADPSPGLEVAAIRRSRSGEAWSRATLPCVVGWDDARIAATALPRRRPRGPFAGDVEVVVEATGAPEAGVVACLGPPFRGAPPRGDGQRRGGRAGGRGAGGGGRALRAVVFSMAYGDQPVAGVRDGGLGPAPPGFRVGRRGKTRYLPGLSRGHARRCSGPIYGLRREAAVGRRRIEPEENVQLLLDCTETSPIEPPPSPTPRALDVARGRASPSQPCGVRRSRPGAATAGRRRGARARPAWSR